MKYYFFLKTKNEKFIIVKNGMLEADKIFQRLYNNQNDWIKCKVAVTDKNDVLQYKMKVQETLNWKMCVREQFQNEYDAENK